MRSWRGPFGKRRRVPRILKPSPNQRGYPVVTVGNKSTEVHRLVARAFMGDRNGLTVNHIDGDKWNNNTTNLEYISAADNVRHAYRTGLRGGTYGNARLTAEQVREIRASTQGLKAVGARYGICPSQVWLIRQRKVWGNIE